MVLRTVERDGMPSHGLGEQDMVRGHERETGRRLGRPSGGLRPWWVAHPVPRRPGPGLDWEAVGSRAVVRVRGDLDGLTARHLDAVLLGRALAGCRELEIDLTGVPSMGSVGLSALLGVRRWSLQRGIVVRLRGVQPSVWRVVELAGLEQTLCGAAESLPGPEQELALF